MQYILTYNNRPITNVSDENQFLAISSEYWVPVTWNGLTDFDGKYIWSDGTNTYYSSGSSQYVLDKSNNTWLTKTWSGASVKLDGRFIWYNPYSNDWIYSNGSIHLALSGSTWETTEFTQTGGGAASFTGSTIWYNGPQNSRRAYRAGGANYRLLDARIWYLMKSTDWPSMRTDYLWYPHDFDTEGKTYYSRSATGYQGVIENETYSSISWSVKPYQGAYVWTSASHTYYSYNNKNYVLNDEKTSWLLTYLPGLNGVSLDASHIWHDGSITYYSYGTTHLKLVND